MREISYIDIAQTVARLCVEANIRLPDSLKEAVRQAKETEASALGSLFLRKMEENYCLAEQTGLPVCQDTGVAAVFCELGQDVHIIGGDFEQAINEGVRRGYTEGHLRMSMAADPLKRKNTGDNTPAVLYTRVVPGDRLKVTVAPKGAGSENMSALKMFKPADGPEQIMEYVTETVNRAGGSPCPPVIVGVGLGGTADQAMLIAKQALLRPVGQPSDDRDYALMEEELLRRINRLGIGPQGLGGQTTALAVHIEHRPVHIASLPCAISFGCHVTRHAEAVL